jgi:hypothetical protein
MSVASNLASLTPALVDQALNQQVAAAKATKAPKRQQATVAKSTVKKSWHVSPEGVKRLGITAVMEGRSESAIVDELLLGLNRYTMPAQNTRGSKTVTTSSDTPKDRQDGVAA